MKSTKSARLEGGLRPSNAAPVARGGAASPERLGHGAPPPKPLPERIARVNAPRLPQHVNLPAPLQELTASWLKRWGAPSAALIFLFALFFVALKLNSLTDSEAGPREGYYWHVAQYHIAFVNMREQLRSEASGHPMQRIEHESRAAALGTMAQRLSDLADSPFFQQVKGFPQAAQQIDQFQARVTAMLFRPDFKQEDAAVAAIEFDRLEPLLSALSDEIQVEEARNRAAIERELDQHRGVFWLLFGCLAVVVVGFVGHLWISRTRERKDSVERQRLLESERAAITAMQAAVTAKGEFLASTSHDLRSPLQSIVSTLDVLELRLKDSAPDEVRWLRRSASSMERFLRDLLTLAKGEAGKLEMQPEPFEACELVRDVAAEFQEAAEAKGLRLVVNVPRASMYLVADHSRISQILTNLLSNAVKYTTSGVVSVSLKPYTEGLLTFEVRDTGSGIPADFLPTMFSPFRRRAAVDRSESSGIGLAIVQTLANHLGAKLVVNSKVGEGSTFRVHLPAAPYEDQDEDEKLLSRSQTARPERLLIVDDRHEVLETMAALSVELGYSTDTADSAAVAANLLSAKAYHLVLIDLEMPFKSGKQFASETRRGTSRNCDTTLIAMSASSDGRPIGEEWPFDGFLQKGGLDRRAFKRFIDGRAGVKRAPAIRSHPPLLGADNGATSVQAIQRLS
jgi:signal transduction histidine kinase